MFDQLFQCPKTIKRHQAGPLLEARVRYLSSYAEGRAALDTLQQIADTLLVISEQMDLQADGEIGVEEIVTAADRWAGRQPRHPSMKHTRKSRARFLSVATHWLSFLGRLRWSADPPPPYAPLLAEFADYMRNEKGLSPLTIKTECGHVAQFLGQFYAQHQSLEEMTITYIDEAIIRKGRQVTSPASVRFYASSLRAFFRFAEQCGWCAPGLADAILAPRVFRHQGLPLGPSWEEVQRLLASTAGDRPQDIRDRALLLLLTIYGLRAGEVCGLRLGDLDWEKEILQIRRPKPRDQRPYPLSQTVGEAILRYLKEVRPRSPHREVFLSLRAPIRPLTGGSLYRRVRQGWRPLGITLRHQGPHALRHACATRLLAEGLSLKEIGDHLGHRDPEATRIYAKVDLAGLRQVADFDLGGLV